MQIRVYPIRIVLHVVVKQPSDSQKTTAITNTTWCDYVVYAETENVFHVERIPFDADFWNNVLYPKLKNVCDEIQLKIEERK